MENKEKKKGFWATLFAPKQKSSCCCCSQIEEAEDTICCTTPPNTDVKEVLVLGPGCASCKKTFSTVERVIKDNGIDVKLSKIEDIAEMMSYNVMTTPAIVVDGKVVIKGRVPSVDEVKTILGIR